MKVIGIVGGIASGKSLVGEQLRRLGARVIDADRLGHEVLEQPVVREALRSRWGANVFTSTDAVDRQSIAARVFGRQAVAGDLEFLEQLTHPLISERMASLLDQWRREGGVDIAILDAPVLWKAGWDRYCDGVLFVAADEDVRRARAVRRGWTAEEFLAREAVQGSLEEKRLRANWIIDNSGTVEQTNAQVSQFWQNLKAISLSRSDS